MKKTRKKLYSWLISMLAVLALAASALSGAPAVYAEEASASEVITDTAAQQAQTLQTTITGINDYGNSFIGVTLEELSAAGYKQGDMITVTSDSFRIDIPYVNSLYDLKFQKPGILLHKSGKPYIVINGGSFAETYGVTAGMPVTLSMKEAGGYLERMCTLNQQPYSMERSDYPDLTDAQFANFREVTTSGIKAKTLYRTSSPVNPKINRSSCADALLKENQVQTIITLGDEPEKLSEYEGYDQTYYKTVNHIEVGMKMDFGSDAFNAALAKGLRFLIANPAPYAIHCQEGKDRTGFVCAVLEMLTGASYDEVVNDYIVTFSNYYGVEPGTSLARVLAKNALISELEYAFGIEDLKNSNLKESTEAYLKKIGLTEGEIQLLKECLTQSLPERKILTARMISISGMKRTYSSEVPVLTVTVKDGTEALKKNVDYTVSCTINKKTGMATVTVKGKGRYRGTVGKCFRIMAKSAVSPAA